MMVITTRDIDTVHGRMRVTVEEDEEVTPVSESLSDGDMATWRNGDWQYVSVTVNPLHSCAQCKDEHAGTEFESMCGVQLGCGDGWRIGIHDLIIIHPVPDLIDQLGARMAMGEG